MTGPVANVGSRNVAREVDDALREGSGWEFFKKQFLPAVVADTFRPADEVLIEIARYSETQGGARVMAWLHELTDGAPYPVGTTSLEETAIAAARHQGRAGVGHVLKKAVAEGKRLLNQPKG